MQGYTKIIKMIPALVAALAVSAAPAFAVVVETDELGVAYVLLEDGTRDYANVPPQPDTSATVEPDVTNDTNSYDLRVPGPGADAEMIGLPEGMDRGRWDRLNDTEVEWDEIEDLVTYWNPTYTRYFQQADTTVTIMRYSYDEFRSQMRETLKEVDEGIDQIYASQKLINQSGMGKAEKQAALDALSTQLETAAEGRRKIISQLDSTKRSLYYAGGTVNNALRPVKNQMVSAVESLVISYKTLEANRALVAEQAALYEALYNTQAAMQAQNLTTSVVTSTYYNQMNTAKKSLADIDAGMARLKKNIALQCGYQDTTEISIADLPEPDYNFLEGRDTEADKKLAVEGNSTVLSAGSLGSYEYSSFGMELRDLGENEARGKASSAFDELLAELKKQLLLSESIETALRKAELTANAAEIKYNSGMLNRAEYEAQRMQLVSYRTSAQLTKLNLLQAIENYRFALLSVMKVE